MLQSQGQIGISGPRDRSKEVAGFGIHIVRRWASHFCLSANRWNVFTWLIWIKKEEDFLLVCWRAFNFWFSEISKQKKKKIFNLFYSHVVIGYFTLFFFFFFDSSVAQQNVLYPSHSSHLGFGHHKSTSCSFVCLTISWAVFHGTKQL